MRIAVLLALLLTGAAAQDPAARPAATGGRTLPDFTLDILPVLTRVGCNAGACHGAAKGQNNFKLSLLGYDPASDYEALALDVRSRRINRARPDDSLMLLKATDKVTHGGRRVLKADSDEYRLLHDWIAGGAPRKTRDETLSDIDVAPARIVQPRDDVRELKVTARYSNGSVRDVTKQSLYSSNDDGIAAVTPAGAVRAVAKGETAIVVRYGGHVRAVLAGASLGGTLREFATANVVDEHLAAKWASLGIVPAAPADDAVFVRRAHLDVIGTLPTPAEARAFLADRAADKRARLIDALLQRPEFETFWTLKFGEWLLVGSKEYPKSYANWIRTQIAKDASLADFTRSLIRTQDPYFANADPRLAMEFTLQAFHGFRMQCANCHNHPLQRFSQDDYHSLSAFYARLRWEDGRIVHAGRGELLHPRTARLVSPRLPNGDVPAADEDRRDPFLRWLVEDRQFHRAWANRLWGSVFGRGLVHPVDDMRASNPPASPELLEALADEFRKAPKLRAFLRLLLTSNAYGLASTGALDDRFFAHAVVRPLPAEVVFDAMIAATGGGAPRAIENVDPTATSYTLESFGRCPRDIACTQRAEFGGSLKQALHLINGPELEKRIAGAKLPEGDVVEGLYWLALSRPPSHAERERWGRPDEETARDLLWALMASKEFQLRH